ncbi:TPA: hypothetical protein HA244_06610 [Candidatus Micrarchaeota archaeon]|nr:hypothetical protein [Candidatus Micrarchaeota archaeon]
MRGFALSAISFVLILSLFPLLAAQRHYYKSSSESVEAALVMEKKYYADLEAKEAFEQVLSETPGGDEKQKTEKTAENLAALSILLEDSFTERGITAKTWFGTLTQNEEENIPRQSLGRGKPVECTECRSFNSKTLDWDKKIVFRSTELLFEGRVSRKGFAHTPSSARWLGRRVEFGVTFVIPGERIAWLSIMPEGFGKRG